MYRIKRTFIVALFILAFGGCYERDVMHGLSEREANSLISRLSDSGIEAEKLAEGKDTWSVRVGQSVAARAIKIISRVHSVSSESAEEEQSGLFLSKEDRKFNLARSLARDIEQTLVVLPGIHEAKVHLKFPEEDPLLAGFGDSSGDQTASSGSASALIIAENGNQYRKEDIASLISGASGIPAERISVWLTIDKIGAVSERPDIKTEDIFSQKLNPPLEGSARLTSTAGKGKSPAWLPESFRICTFDETISYIKANAGISIGVVLITISIIILTWIKTSRVKQNPAIIPSYMP